MRARSKRVHAPAMAGAFCLGLILALAPPARALRRAAALADAADATQALYDKGQSLLNGGQWEQAIAAFESVVQAHGARADGALYWKAYALNKLGRRADALAALGALQAGYPRSTWRNDADALRLEIQQAAGQPVSPASQPDEDLKLIAINGLMSQDPQRAVPLLEKVLASADAERIKERALFVLAQSGSPEARTALARVAEGQDHPELQTRAVQYLGLFGGASNGALLGQIYRASSQPQVKRAVLHADMLAGNRDSLLAAAQSESDASLRTEAIHMLGIMGATDQLTRLYPEATSPASKKAILQALFISGRPEPLYQLEQHETDPELKRDAVRDLGLMGADKTGTMLASVYAQTQDAGVRKAVVQAYFLQNNAHQLVAMARSETDPKVKAEIVRELSLMHSKEASDYMMELLNQ